MKIECTRCGEKVIAELLKSYVTFDKHDLCDLKFSFLKCPGCNGPILTYQYQIGKRSVDGKIKGDNYWDEPYLIYPQPFKEISNSVPKPIKNAYQEALSCYNSGSFTAATILCRKILEGICRFHNIETGNLKTDLKEMKDKGIIDSRLFNWADALRNIVNENIHIINSTSSKQEAKTIIEFTNALLEYLFTFNDIFNTLERKESGSPIKKDIK